MNAPRVADLHRELARLHGELADAIVVEAAPQLCPECAERDLDQVDAALVAREALEAPVELALLATETGGFEVEQELHQRFRSLRMHGEWFQPGAELVAHIDSLRSR